MIDNPMSALRPELYAHIPASRESALEDRLLLYVNLKLAAIGQPTSEATKDPYFLEIAAPLLKNHQEQTRLLGPAQCAVDCRIQTYLDDYLSDVCPDGAPRLPANTFVLDRPGLARLTSLPAGSDTFLSPHLSSYRVAQGVLHNPRSDRRTTKGIFHIVEGGLPVSADKLEVPKAVFAALLAKAFQPPDDTLVLPFTSNQQAPAKTFVSLLLRPLVCPATGRSPEKRMESRFFAPGSLVSNLDFVESIFGNAGDPYLPENDAALDVMHWTGHTGCVILAPHIAGLKKVDLGLPHYDQATPRQRQDGMCWRDENELYNDGEAFKLACRDERGVMVTLIADNYFGYCKKDVKTQISYSANLFGLCEEEHAGGAIAFPSYVLGQLFQAGRTVRLKEASFEETILLLEGQAEVRPEGYAVDKVFPNIFYLPYLADFSARDGVVRWTHDGKNHELPIRPGDEFVLPAGYRVRMEKQGGGTFWRLVGVRPDGTLCHKPCTVSGGGKSEISKSIAGAIVKGPLLVRDFHRDTELVREILRMDTASIFKDPDPGERARRPVLSKERSLGSVIKLLTPSPDYKDDYNQWLRELPQTIRQYVCFIKRYYRPEMGDNWDENLSVDTINGVLWHELKFENKKLVANYLRVGYERDGTWRLFNVRPDFNPAFKVQVEDDITASVTVPRASLSGVSETIYPDSVKLVENCESMLFQRPDDAIHRGADEQAEGDIAADNVFLSNFEPVSREEAGRMVDHVSEFDRYSDPMKQRLLDFVEGDRPEWVAASDRPRLVDGKPSKNPRYLQRRPDLADARETHIAYTSARLYRRIPTSQPLYFPVDAVLAGRRNNTADPEIGLPPLCMYSPIHYQELPELFMDYVCSLTGKSPSTTGFGSEGALTKNPFNAVPPVVDLNNALVSSILTGQGGFTTAAAYVGPHYRVDHDISMLVPEIWCRMSATDRSPAFLIANGFLEKLDDFDHKGQRVLASRLGYRITNLFADRFLGRIFETPNLVFTEAFLRPETQDMDAFAAGVHAMTEAQARVARTYFADGTVDAACPPLRALLHIMAFGSYEGKGLEDAGLRNHFTRESMLASEWYRERLRVKQRRDIALWTGHVRRLEGVQDMSAALRDRSSQAREELARVSQPHYMEELIGTIGADPFLEPAAVRTSQSETVLSDSKV